ncbi:MAG: DUF951 domain-containing protein [Oscillospiraceae bacterium]|nr:DUF951 domain-containing protein [Oscillospiraceae bacterium]
MDVLVGDIITLKKKHPCGAVRWQVLRVGMDFKLRCTGCGHEIMNARGKVEKNIKELERNGAPVDIRKKT